MDRSENSRTVDDVVIRRASGEDALGWATFLAHCQGETYRGLVPEQFESERLAEAESYAQSLVEQFVADDGSQWVLAEADGNIAGVVAVLRGPMDWEVDLGYLPPPVEWQLHRLYVDHRWHGTGLAQRLLEAVIDDRDLYLWLINGNVRAQKFYHRYGFLDLDEQVDTGPSWGHLPMHRMVRRRTAQ